MVSIQGVNLTPSKSSVISFLLGAVIGFIIDQIVLVLVYNTEIKKHIDFEQEVIPGLHLDDFILLVTWIVIATKKPMFGLGGIIGTVLGTQFNLIEPYFKPEETPT